MKKSILAFIVLLLPLISLSAENHSTASQQKVASSTIAGFDRSRITLGGGFGLQFGDYTVVNIAPQIGYNVTDYFNAGFGIAYTYYKDDFYSGGSKWTEKNNYFGVNVYGRLLLLDYIALKIQPEINGMSQKITEKLTGAEKSENKLVPTVLVGAGVALGPVTAMIQYDLVQDDYSPYGDKLFYSVGYTFHF